MAHEPLTMGPFCVAQIFEMNLFYPEWIHLDGSIWLLKTTTLVGSIRTGSVEDQLDLFGSVLTVLQIIEVENYSKYTELSVFIIL